MVSNGKSRIARCLAILTLSLTLPIGCNEGSRLDKVVGRLQSDDLEKNVTESGQLLIATRQIRGPMFERSVVLLLDYSPRGAMGLIVNRPTTLRLREALPEITDVNLPDDLIFLGGPVETTRFAFLIRSLKEPPHSDRVFADIYVSRRHELLLDGDAPDSNPPFRAYLGYAGWSAGQLDAEIARGDWFLARAELDNIFAESPENLWDRLIFEHEGTLVRSPSPSVSPLASIQDPIPLATAAIFRARSATSVLGALY